MVAAYANAVQWCKSPDPDVKGITSLVPMGTHATVIKNQKAGSSDVRCTLLNRPTSSWLLQNHEIDVSNTYRVIIHHINMLCTLPNMTLYCSLHLNQVERELLKQMVIPMLTPVRHLDSKELKLLRLSLKRYINCPHIRIIYLGCDKKNILSSQCCSSLLGFVYYQFYCNIVLLFSLTIRQIS